MASLTTCGGILLDADQFNVTIKGDYIGTDSQFVNIVKDTSGVKININELGVIANTTGAEDVVT